ncbi:MAG: Flp1 family type IVb pilin [Eubacteriales bacterium]|nr:Flp1 family type IVb pilin [Eubacteriales bacterium]
MYFGAFIKRALNAAGLEVKRFAEDESGVGVIEVVLILVVLIGLVAVFKTQINELLTKIFTSISSMSDDIL